jgi:uncharacterized membrane protein
MAIVGLGLGTEGSLYRLLLLLHIACAAVGFGALAFSGLYRVRARAHGGDTEMIMLEENAVVTHFAEYLIYAVFVFGLLVGLTSQSLWQFSQSWLSLSMLLYMIELGLLHAIIHRSEREYYHLLRKVNAASGGSGGGGSGDDDQGDDVAQLERLEQRIGWGWAGFNVIFLIILYLMVFTPGHLRVG